MEILQSLSNWLSSKDLGQKDEEIPAAPSQSILTSILSSVDNVKRVIKNNLTDLVTDTDNALTKTADYMDKEVLSKKNLQDPAQWLSGNSGSVVGAFRPVNSKILPSTLAKVKGNLRQYGEDPNVNIPFLDKLSNKEINKYGTTDSILDKYLPSTNDALDLEVVGPREVKLTDFLEQNPGINMLKLRANIMARRAREFQRDPTDSNKEAFSASQNGLLNALIQNDARMPLVEDDIRALRDQIKDKTPIYTFDDYSVFGEYYGDIPRALDKIDGLVSKSNYTPEQLSKKSLQQLLGIADAVQKVINKDTAVVVDYTKQRTAELKAQQGLPNDLVELRDRRDFGAETYFLNHCVGAGGAEETTGKFLPKWNPVTGEVILKNNNFQNSADIYYGFMERGIARYFSYRPEGLPVATVEVDKYGNIKQLYGEKNSEVPPDIKRKILTGLDSFIPLINIQDIL